MAVLTCKICGGDLTVLDGKAYAICGSCGIKQTMPRFDDDKRTNLYNRANHYRRNQDFDKAIAIYETILNEDGQDAEAYWSLVLCKYGVEFVQDPETRQWMITCNRTQFTSVFGDEDYKAAIQYASSAFAKRDYERLASWIEEIQKEILEISKNEKPYDIFICYKESDQYKKRTLDSALAQDIYQELINEGYRIFFSRITLAEVALGKDYEPQIFAALNSARVMILIGTSPMNINSPWVKNEWSRYLALIKQGAKKTLIVAYRDMDPYDLPDELSRFQALDMTRIGFIQDLSHGIKKLLKTDEKAKTDSTGTPSVAAKSNDALLDRAYMCLEDGDYAKATTLLEQVLNNDPRNGRAYLGQLLAKHSSSKIEQLSSLREKLSDDPLYRRAVQFSNQETKSKLESIALTIDQRIEKDIKEREEKRAAAERARAIEKAKEEEERAAAERARAIEQKNKYEAFAIYSERIKLESSIRSRRRTIFKCALSGLGIGAIIGLAVSTIAWMFTGGVGHIEYLDAILKPIIICGCIGLFMGFFVGASDKHNHS